MVIICRRIKQKQCVRKRNNCFIQLIKLPLINSISFFVMSVLLTNAHIKLLYIDASIIIVIDELSCNHSWEEIKKILE